MLTTRRLNDITVRLWDTGIRYGGWFLTWAALWLVAITFLGLWLPGVVVATLAIVVPIGIAIRFVVRYIWWPTGPIAIAANQFVKEVSKIDLAKFVLAIMAIELGWGLCVAYWPIEDSPRLLIPFVGLVILAVLLWKLGLKKLSWTAAVIAALVLLNIPAEGTFATQTSAQTTSVAEQAPVQTAGLLIVHRSTEEDICSLAEGQDYEEFYFEEVGDKCLIRVSLDARHVRIDSVPSGTPYKICYRDERKGIDLGCYVDTPNSQNTIRLGQEGDFDDLDELSVTLVTIKPMTTIGIRIWP